MRSLRAHTARFAALALLILLSLSVAACGGAEQPAATATAAPGAMSEHSGTAVHVAGGSYTNVQPAELKAMLDNKDFFMVDVHTPPEGRLPRTDARVVYDTIAQHLDQLPADKNAKIVITCRSGHMSGIASETLVGLGYTNIFNLAGGMNAWTAAGYELIPEGQ